MRIAVMSFRLHAPWVHSLKEKRMIVKSILARLQNRFHVSAAEIDEQDTHQIIVIGVAAIIPNNAVADSLWMRRGKSDDSLCGCGRLPCYPYCRRNS